MFITEWSIILLCFISDCLNTNPVSAVPNNTFYEAQISPSKHNGLKRSVHHANQFEPNSTVSSVRDWMVSRLLNKDLVYFAQIRVQIECHLGHDEKSRRFERKEKETFALGSPHIHSVIHRI